MPADASLVQSFWTYPASAPTVAPGRPLDFKVVVPPPTGALFPLTGSVVNWKLTDVATANPLVSGVDYQLLDGDLNSPFLSVVFAPIANRTVSVVPEVRLFYWDATATPPSVVVDTITNPADYPQFAPRTYTLEGIDAVKASLLPIIKDALCVVTEKTIIEPGEPALLNVLPRSMSTVPQAVTSVVDEAPKVEIRGAIPLKGLVDAIIGPLTGALSRAVPGSRASLESAGNDVARLLGQALSIPLAIDVLGKRVSKTLAPVGDLQAPIFTSTPAETRSLEGLVPIGKWQLPFTIARVEWWIDGAAAMDLSPGVDFIKAFLLLPKLVALSRSDPASLPSRVTVHVRLHVDVKTDVVAVLGSIDLSLDLQVLPLAIPRVATIFRHEFAGRNGSDQWVAICPDVWTAPFMPSLDDALRLFTRIGTVLNNIAAVAHRLAAVDAAERPAWSELMDLATAFSMLTDQVGRADPGDLRLTPAWDGQVIFTPAKGRISAVIYIGLRDSVHCEIGMRAEGSDYIRMDSTCVLPSLRGRFDELVQVPPGSATATNESRNYNERQQLRFVGCPPTQVLGGTEMAPDLEVLREFRDRVLLETTAGRRYVRVLERHALEIASLLHRDEDLAQSTLDLAKRLTPVVRRVNEGRPTTLDEELIGRVDTLLESASAKGSTVLRTAVADVRKELRHFAGRTPADGLERASREAGGTERSAAPGARRSRPRKRPHPTGRSGRR